ncbi:MAG: lipocalin-like domain-containing protein [Parabacteroides sp.]
MKRYIIAVLLTLIVSACGKTPINGDLDGRWQIMKIAYASGGEKRRRNGHTTQRCLCIQSI